MYHYCGGMYAARETMIIQLMRTYAAATGKKLSTVGRLCSGDSRLIKRLDNHGSLSQRVFHNILLWFSNRWPADLLWPANISRPNPAPNSPAAKVLIASLGIAEPDSALTDLNDKGHINDPQKFLEALAPAGINPILRDTFDQVIAQYADGRSRANKRPKKGSKAARVLDALVAAGDVRFTKLIERTRHLDDLAQKFGLAS